jgi:aspartate aminotransferase/aromatic-amino-acid transaminase
METFNDISENVLVTIAFSSSKTVTSYGLRCGAAMILAKTPEAVRESEIYMEKRARSTWSNIPNAAMENFTWIVTENRDAFLAEKQKYIDLLRERSSLFLAEAEACGLEHYPYKEGFFVTLKVEDNKKRALVHEELMKRHIYTVMVNHGIRVALCSLPLKKIKGLAAKLKEAEDAVL